MLAVLLAAALNASPTPCPADLLVSNPRVKTSRGAVDGADVYVVTVDISNRGVAAQPADTRQHLDVVHDGQVLGSQPIPVLGPQQTYAAAFRVTIPHASASASPARVEFHYVLDSKNAPRANCTTVNDKLTATLR